MLIKKIKFEKSNYPIIPVGYIILLVLTLVSFLSVACEYLYKLDISNFLSPVKPISINIETNNSNINPRAFVCYDNICVIPEKENFLSSFYYSKFDKFSNNSDSNKINKIFIAYPKKDKNFEDNIKQVYLNIGNENYYFNSENIKQLQKQEYDINVSSSNSKKVTKETYTTLLLSNQGNYRGIFNNVCTIFLSLFYNWEMFVVPYILLALSLLFYFFNKKEILYFDYFKKIKIKYVIYTLISLGFLLRINSINYNPLSIDEIYTKIIAIKNYQTIFHNIQNPPLYYILEYIINKIFMENNVTLRAISFILGIIILPFIYAFLKSYNKNIAIIAMFLASINIIFINYSAIATNIALCSFVLILNIYLLFKYLNTPTTKKLILYSISAILMFNSHYYLMILCCINTIWGIVHLIQKKKKKESLYFILSNLIALITATPYLITTYKTMSSTNFNNWIFLQSNFGLENTINTFFLNKFLFFAFITIILIDLIIVYLPKNILNKTNINLEENKENIFVYLIYTIIFFFVIAGFISDFRPFLNEKSIFIIYPLLFLLETVTIFGIFDFINKNKFLKFAKIFITIILLLCYFKITYLIDNSSQNRFDDYFAVISKDIKNYSKDYEIHVFIENYKEYLLQYPEIQKLNINWHVIDIKNKQYLKNFNKRKYTQNKAVFYLYDNVISVHDFLKTNLKSDIIKTNSITTLKVELNP